MSPICPQLTELYQTWSDSLALMREARLRYLESGAVIDKQAFDEALTSARIAQVEYNHEAYEMLVEYRGDKIFGLEALVVQIMDARLVKGGGGTSSLTVESGCVMQVYIYANTSSTIDSALKLIPHLRSLTRLDCDNTSITELPNLPDSLTWLNCSHTSITELPKLPDPLTRLNCSHTSITELPELPASLIRLYCSRTSIKELPELPDSLIWLDCSRTSITELPNPPDSLYFISILGTPAAEDPKVQEKLMAFKTAHPSATVLF